MRNNWVKPCLKILWAGLLALASTQSHGFTDHFDQAEPLVEAPSMEESKDPNWWLNSGGYIHRCSGIAATTQGELSGTDYWRLIYSLSNHEDTDSGYHPQNIIRLVTREKFKNFTQTVHFKIEQIRESASQNRNASNGILFFHRYLDGENVYYAGIRVDGHAVIKKKLHGHYTTLKSIQVYPGVYQRETSPNLLPMKQWIGMRTTILDLANGNVSIGVELKDELLGLGWTRVLSVVDAGETGERLLEEGHAGIRTDFMDVRLDDYEAKEMP